MKDSVVMVGRGVYEVLSSKQDKYYLVDMNKLSMGLKPCSCKSRYLQCKHLNMLVAWMSVKSETR